MELKIDSTTLIGVVVLLLLVGFLLKDFAFAPAPYSGNNRHVTVRGVGVQNSPADELAVPEVATATATPRPSSIPQEDEVVVSDENLVVPSPTPSASPTLTPRPPAVPSGSSIRIPEGITDYNQ